MKLILFLAALMLISAATADAQVSVIVSRTALFWTWEPAPESGEVDEFIIKCGNQAASYTRTVAVGPTLREVPLKSLITGQGNWFCIVVASNPLGESEASNEVPFVAAGGPVGKLTATLKGI
jgi:hypothetical protein